MKTSIFSYNDKLQLHGYQERYYSYNCPFNLPSDPVCSINTLKFRGNYQNDARVGYCEWLTLKETEYYIQ